jgi:hypothetical protein
VKRLTTDEAKKAALQCFERAMQPVLVGPVSLALGWSLQETEELLFELVEEGLIRQLTYKELDRHDLLLAFSPIGVSSDREQTS